jgi:uncharacterized protein (DUF433 family)
MQPAEYIEIRDGGYYVSGTRIGLDVIFHDFQRGRSPEVILQAYPSMGFLGKVYGVIAFMLDHPNEVECYLQNQERSFEAVKTKYPMPAELLEHFEQTRKSLA